MATHLGAYKFQTNSFSQRAGFNCRGDVVHSQFLHINLCLLSAFCQFISKPRVSDTWAWHTNALLAQCETKGSRQNFPLFRVGKRAVQQSGAEERGQKARIAF